MKSIKPGRGPSMLGGIVGIFMCCFGVLWTVFAAQASWLFALFGVFWTGIAVVQTVFNFKNATGKNRYSSYDITDENEEPDPWNERFGGGYGDAFKNRVVDSKFCPYCGAEVEDDFEFCNKCGKRLP